ncbi:MAG TPA: Gfo/Idh/MocA family oxidoreductase [Armatimonadota bacterium]|nr:Gfo/Idh/MocA family oxidoreductase [Armatimonadota bacterium]
MADERIGFAIAGCGVIAPWHAYGITHSGLTELRAVFDVVFDRAKGLAADVASKYGVPEPRVCRTLDELLEDSSVSALSVCTPSGLHAEIGIAAAGAGKHVLCEKPIDITLEHIDALVRACQDAGVKLGCIFQRRTSPLWQGIRRAVREGALGKMLLGDAYLKYYRSQAYYDSGDWRGTWALDGGGCLMNQGVHCIDQVQWIMGPVRSLYAQTDHLARSIEVEDVACAVLRFESGAMGVLEGTTGIAHPGVDHRLEFHGETGTIRVFEESIVEWNVPGVDQGEFIPRGTAGQEAATADPTAIGMEGHLQQIRDMAEAIRDDRDPMVTGPEARKAVEIILAVYRSSQQGQPVSFPLEQ